MFFKNLFSTQGDKASKIIWKSMLRLKEMKYKPKPTTFGLKNKQYYSFQNH